MTAPMGMPAVTPSASSIPAPPPVHLQRTPPPPPGRGSLPPVVAPPPKTLPPPPPAATVAIPKAAATVPGPGPVAASPLAAPAPAPADVHAAATAPNPSIDMEWDDEDEATHIFDKTDDAPLVTREAAPLPAAGAPALTTLPKKTTLLGMTAPLPPPPTRSSTPPPPPGNPFTARTSSMPAPGSFPPPPPPHALGMTMPLHAMPAPPPPPANPLMGMPPPAPMPSVRPVAPVNDYVPPAPRAMEATALLRPQSSRSSLWIAAAVAGVAVIGAIVFFLIPRTGRLAINATDGKGGSVDRLEIFVDGRKTPCETAPCIVDQVSAGSHEVKVLADGYETAQPQAVNVQSGGDAPVTFTLSTAAKATGLKVSGSQAGVKLFVDDKEIGPLPQEVKDLPAGDHAIRIAGTERYQPLDKHITVEKDKVEDLGAITLKVLKGKATITLATSGARVFLVSGSDRRELPTLPISVDIDTTKTWSLQATKAGYSDYNQAISFDDGQAEKSYVVSLDLKGPAITSAPPAAAPPAAVAAAVPPAVTHTQPAATESGGGGGGASEGSEAFLNINSVPPSTCFLDGRSLGSTPKAHITVKPGTHSVKFVNADQGLSKTISVTVGAGETKPAVAKLN